MIHTFEMTDQIGLDGCYVLRNHVLVHLRFHEVYRMHLQKLCQNSLFGLSIVNIRERQMERVHFEVEFGGLGDSFQCHRVEVIDVTPCTDKGESLPQEIRRTVGWRTVCKEVSVRR